MIDEKLLIERLEEESDYEPIDYDYCDMSCSDVEHFISTRKAIEIVNQLAEEHKDDFCEWVVKDYGGTQILREPHRMYLFKASEDEWEYCPYCGKKIKVVE